MQQAAKQQQEFGAEFGVPRPSCECERKNELERYPSIANCGVVQSIQLYVIMRSNKQRFTYVTLTRANQRSALCVVVGQPPTSR